MIRNILQKITSNKDDLNDTSLLCRYVEWSLHNPKDDEYTFEGIADVENFIKIAQEEDLYVILRPGPYICAERDNVSIFVSRTETCNVYNHSIIIISRVVSHIGSSRSTLT